MLAKGPAFPDGDKDGSPLPLLDDLPNIVGRTWTDVLKLASPPVTGFEAQFSWIRKCGKFADELARVEALPFQYFDELELPDIPTIYDYLVPGLRAKDTIATFNWDPLLLLAHRGIGMSLNCQTCVSCTALLHISRARIMTCLGLQMRVVLNLREASLSG